MQPFHKRTLIKHNTTKKLRIQTKKFKGHPKVNPTEFTMQSITKKMLPRLGRNFPRSCVDSPSVGGRREHFRDGKAAVSIYFRRWFRGSIASGTFVTVSYSGRAATAPSPRNTPPPPPRQKRYLTDQEHFSPQRHHRQINFNRETASPPRHPSLSRSRNGFSPSGASTMTGLLSCTPRTVINGRHRRREIDREIIRRVARRWDCL